MAKRKRLTPANPAFLDTPAPETKSMFATAPIADVARDASSTAALNEMADTLAQAREEGRMVVDLPLHEIEVNYLVRDRLVVDEEDMRALKMSLRSRGQQTPVEVMPLADGRYGLISGWRRCTALAQIAEEDHTYEPTVLALLRKPEEASDAYLAMVEENEIRVDLSYFERARIVSKAVEEGVFGMERTALQTLFNSASRAKRSKIGSFLPVVRALDGHVRFPHALSERLGLGLAQALNDDPQFADVLRDALAASSVESAEAEVQVLAKALSVRDASLKGRLETEAKPTFRDETVGAFTLRRHEDGTLSILGASWPKRCESDLIQLLKAASDSVVK